MATLDTENPGPNAKLARESTKSVSPTMVAGEVAENVILSMFDNVVNSRQSPFTQGSTSPCREDAALLKEQIQGLLQLNAGMKLQVEQLKAEVASSQSAKKESESQHHVAQGFTEDFTRQLDSLQLAKKSLAMELEAVQSQLTFSNGQKAQLEKDVASAQLSLESSECEVKTLRQKLEGQLQGQEAQSSREQELEMERVALREHASSQDDQVLALQNQLTALQAQNAEAHAIIAEQSDLAMRKEVSTSQATVELPADSGEEKPLLAAAYQQISVLNTQLAHLYTELTMARTEVQRLRSEQSSGANRTTDQAADSEAEVLKQSQQIADLVLDIRHLQLDLEYHQQKLDQMIEEKQQMMRDLKKSQGELEESRRVIEERDQMLKHREVDLKQLKEDMRTPRGGGAANSEMEGDGTLAALRAEAAAKDSALIVSHYELHKEKLLRDRLEQKNLKLMERMQKLMMVVETMRKENVTLERNLVAREQNCETKEQQLRQVTQKAKQLQKIAKAAKAGQKSGVKTYELGSPPQQPLPPLDRSQRSVDSGGRRSGASTPRTPRCPPSPYGTR